MNIMKLLGAIAAAATLIYIARKLHKSARAHRNNRILQIRLAAAMKRQQESDRARAQAIAQKIAQDEAKEWGEK